MKSDVLINCFKFVKIIRNYFFTEDILCPFLLMTSFKLWRLIPNSYSSTMSYKELIFFPLKT